MNKIKVMMLSKKSNIFCDYAEVLLRSYFESNEILSIRGDAAKHPEGKGAFVSIDGRKFYYEESESVVE